jgi:hemerythrin
MVLQWSDSLSTSVDQIDREHRELIVRVNGLLAALDKGTGREEMTRTIQFLSDYVVFHFGNEERAMAQYGYMDARQHKAQHELFVKTFGRLKERLLMEGTGPQLIEDTRQLVVDWLVNHIKYADRGLGLFLKRKIV